MFESFKSLDWRAFVLALSFGYLLSIFPLLAYLWRASMTSDPNLWTFVLFRAEAYLVFSIIAFSSVGSLLSNSDAIDFTTVLCCSANIIFGVMMFGCFSEFDALDGTNASTVRNIVKFGTWSWILSALIFAFSHLRTKAVTP